MRRQYRQILLPFCRGRSLTARGGYRNHNDNDNDNNGFRCGAASNRSQPVAGRPGQDASRLTWIRSGWMVGLCPERTTDLILMADKPSNIALALLPVVGRLARSLEQGFILGGWRGGDTGHSKLPSRSGRLSARKDALQTVSGGGGASGVVGEQPFGTERRPQQYQETGRGNTKGD